MAPKLLKKKSNAISWSQRYTFNSQTPLYALGAFIFFTFLIGGGSRDDIQSLIILRPIAILFAAYALIYKLEKQVSWNIFPFIVLLLLALLMMIQLIPLPPELWTKLPEREIFVNIADLAGIKQPWRPMSLSPSKTWNSLLSLSVPIAAMMMFMNVARKDRKKVMLIIMALIALSAILGVLQTLGNERGALYFYRITNNGAAVGLFANRNHQSVMLAALILFLGWYSFYAQKGSFNPLKISLIFGGIFSLIPLIFITGSRSGLLLMVPALSFAVYYFYTGTKNNAMLKNSKSSPKKGKKHKLSLIEKLRSNSNIVILLTITAIIIALAGASIIFSRSLAFDRLFNDGNIGELRIQLAPLLWEIGNRYFPVGSGFGSFEHIYKIYEPDALLNPSYLNQAHNDWLQYFIEGGLPAILILGALILYLVRHSIMLIRNWTSFGEDRITISMGLFFMGLIALASIGDYPLRVPSIMLTTSIILSYLAIKIKNHNNIK